MPSPFDQMKAVQPVAELLERADLAIVEGRGFERRQAEVADALRAIARAKNVWRLRLNPGRICGEAGQVLIVSLALSMTLCEERGLPPFMY